MNKKILETLKTKYKDLGLGEHILKVFADKLAKTVKEESEIDTAVEDVESDLRIYQSLTDQNRTLQKKIQELENAKEGDDKNLTTKPEQKPEEGTKDSEMPAWAQALMESNKTLSDSLQKLQAEKIQQSNAEKLTSKLKELGVNENFYKLHIEGKTFDNDEQLNVFASQLKECQDAYNQALSNNLLKSQANPLFGNKAVEGQIDTDVQNYINQNFNEK